MLAQYLFDPLGAVAERAQSVAAAGRAVRLGLLLAAAVMAAQPALALVINQMGIAALAARHPAAVEAEQGGRITAPVQEQQGLMAALQEDLHGMQQRFGEIAGERSKAQEDDEQHRQSRIDGAMRK